jgi:hypothetical protein
MASTYSTNLAIELIANGEQTGTWGSTTNSNLGTLIEQAISGYVTQAVSTGTDTTITIPNGTTGVARNMFIELTGTGGASTNLIVPANKKLYFIYNNTSSGPVTVKVSGLTGISVANGTKVVLVSNGTDIVSAASYTISNSAVTFSSITDSGLTATRVTYAGTAGLLQDSANLTFSGTILTSTGFAGPLNGTVGATTANTGAFTTLTTSSNATVNGLLTAVRISNAAEIEVARIRNDGTGNLTAAAVGYYLGNTLYVEQIAAYNSQPEFKTDISGSTVTKVVAAGLEVTGTLSSTLDATIYGVTVGRGAGAVATNTTVGASALAANTTGANNTAIGDRSLSSNTTASNNTAVGYQAGYSNTTGTENLFAGYRAGYLATGSYAVSIGNEAGYSNTDATNGNVFVGYQSGRANTSGTAVVAIGAASLLANTTGSYNTAIGRSALLANTTASNNTAVGYQALTDNTTADSNSAFGYFALRGNTTGTTNTAVSFGALQQNTTGSSNTAIGTQALTSNTTASSNTAVGYQAGSGITTGASNVYIGYAAAASAVSVSSEIVVGASITGKGANTAFIGGTSGAYNGANTTTWSVTSDIRIKKNVASLALGLDVVQALRPVKFDYIENDKHDIGFIAQEYQTVLPDQVVEGADGMLSLNQNLVPYLVKAMQEQQAIIESLKARLDAANI